MIMVPDWITDDMFATAITKASASSGLDAFDKIRLETLDEGSCVQTLHIGSFDDEAGVLDRMHSQFLPQEGLQVNGKHHEIYFSDIRKVAPEKLRTILRQPVR